MAIGIEGFIGQRLSEVREARGHTITSLVQALGGTVTVAAISQYEKGTSAPRPQIAEQLATTLNVPISIFFKPLQEGGREHLYWRSLSSATKLARTRARRKYDWLKEIANYLQLYLDFPEPELPEIHLSHDAGQLQSDDIEEAAQACRTAWGLGSEPIANIVSVVENLGVIVTRASIDSDRLDAFSCFSSDRKRPFVFLGEDKSSAARSRLDCGHELGHLVLHSNVPQEMFADTSMHKRLEQEAFEFGIEFLFPKPAFLREFRYPTLDAFLRLKQKWNVSIAALIRRADQLGCLKENQARNLWINYSRRGWKRKEPLDGVIEPETPRMLRVGIEMIVEQGIRSRSQIAKDLCLNHSDIENICGLPTGYLIDERPNILLKSVEKLD